MENLINYLETIRSNKEAFDELKKIKNEADEIFNCHRSLEEIQKIKDKAWGKLIKWKRSYPDLLIELNIEPFVKLDEEFSKLENGEITNRELVENIKPLEKTIQKKLELFEKNLKRSYEEVSKFYDEFAKKDEVFGFIFENPEIKRIIISDFLGIDNI